MPLDLDEDTETGTEGRSAEQDTRNTDDLINGHDQCQTPV